MEVRELKAAREERREATVRLDREAEIVPNPKYYGKGYSIRIHVGYEHFTGSLFIPFTDKHTAEMALETLRKAGVAL